MEEDEEDDEDDVDDDYVEEEATSPVSTKKRTFDAIADGEAEKEPKKVKA